MKLEQSQKELEGYRAQLANSFLTVGGGHAPGEMRSKVIYEFDLQNMGWISRSERMETARRGFNVFSFEC